MPIKIPKDLPAYKLFKEENIFVMHNERADSQDIHFFEFPVPGATSLL